MKRTKKLAAIVVATAVVTTGAIALSACGGGSAVAGTYKVDYTTETISGNVEMNGYIVALQCTETNTLVLKDDNTYEYTKYLVQHRDTSQYASVSDYGVATLSDTVDENILFSWTSAGDGNCTLDFYKDGTFKFFYTTMGMTEKGTWAWDNWTMTITQSNDNVINVTMDDEHAFNVHYVAVAGGGQLYHDFVCSSDVWGVAFGGQGSYTPVEGGGNTDDDETPDDNTPSAGSTVLEIEYVFKGTYEYEGQTVTLNPATSCTWKEDWGALRIAAGFIDCSGTENDLVHRNNAYDDCNPLTYFGGKYFYSSGNTAVKVKLNGNTFEYIEESVFD